MDMTQARKILVIDDDIAACAMIEQTLGKLGFDVIISHDARGGFETAKAIIPDLIFINLLLPDTNGLKVSKAVHSLDVLKSVPVIMFISSQGELDARYTVTIGIVDTLVKPLKTDEIIAKTNAVLGADAAAGIAEEAIREIPVEDVADSAMIQEEEEIPEEETLFMSEGQVDEYQEEDSRDEDGAGVKFEIGQTMEGEDDMSKKKKPAEKKGDAFDDKDLFSDDADMFGEELKKSMEEVQRQPSRDLYEEELKNDLASETKSASRPFRRIMFISASVIGGIALGIGGYLFFTAGDSQAPGQKQVTRVLPEPAAVPPAPSVDKPNVIPEIPVKQEPQKPELPKTDPAQAKEVTLQEDATTALKNAAAQRAEPEKLKKEPPPAAAKPDAKENEPKKPVAKKKEAPAVSKAKRTYYIQAGLFESEANANALAEKIKEKGYTAEVKSVETAEKKVFYRVTAGTYTSFNGAVAASETLNKQGISAIVRKQ